MRSALFAFGLIVFCANYALAAPQQHEKLVEVLEPVKSVNSESGEAMPKFWRVILGDICQLPSFPRATGDPNRYIECVRSGSSESSDRKDLGVWLLRECLPNYEFVASARRCKTVRSVRRQQQICDGPNSANYQFCPTKLQNDVKFVVRETRQAPISCTCPNGEQNCVCPSPEILEPIAVVSAPVPTVATLFPELITTPAPNGQVVVNGTELLADGVVIESSGVVMPQVHRAMAQTYGQCPCPVQMPNCICQPAPIATQQPATSNQCCAPQQQPPCQCQQPGPIPAPQPVTQAPQSCPSQCPQPQSPSCQCTPTAVATPAANCPCPQEPSCQCQPVQAPTPACPCPQQPSCQCQPATAAPMMVTQQACPCPQQPNCQCQPQCQTTTTQQQYCPQAQSPVVMSQPCPLVQGGPQNAQYQGICSWMIDPLAADPSSPANFLQCQPAPNNLFCGRWQRMPCETGLIFSVSAQVCVWDPNATPGPIPPPQPQQSQCGCTGGVQIGSCNQNYQCPGQSVCQVAQPSCPVCCYFHKKKQ